MQRRNRLKSALADFAPVFFGARIGWKKNTKTEKNTGILSSFIHAFRKFISAKELLSHTLSILNNYSN